MTGMTRAELLALPAAIDLVTAAKALSTGRSKAFDMARDGTWPTPLLRLGSAYRVPTAALLRLLEIDPDMDATGAPAPVVATTTDELSGARDAKDDDTSRALRSV